MRERGELGGRVKKEGTRGKVRGKRGWGGRVKKNKIGREARRMERGEERGIFKKVKKKM